MQANRGRGRDQRARDYLGIHVCVCFVYLCFRCQEFTSVVLSLNSTGFKCFTGCFGNIFEIYHWLSEFIIEVSGGSCESRWR